MQWNAYARTAAVQTIVATGLAPVANVWNRLRIDVDALGARFYIGPAGGPAALVASIAPANLPIAGQKFGSWAMIQKGNGAGQRNLFIDYAWRGFNLEGVR